MTKYANTGDMLRAQYVKRWHIVPTNHQQTVAEHSWNVAIIARAIVQKLYETIGRDVHLDINHSLLYEYALLHDVEEVLVGDTPTPVKRFVKSITGFDPFEYMADAGFDHDVTYVKELAKGTPEKEIVKLADLMDAYLFADRHVVDPKYRMQLLATLENAMSGQTRAIWIAMKDCLEDIEKYATLDMLEVLTTDVFQECTHGAMRCGMGLYAEAKAEMAKNPPAVEPQQEIDNV